MQTYGVGMFMVEICTVAIVCLRPEIDKATVAPASAARTEPRVLHPLVQSSFATTSTRVLRTQAMTRKQSSQWKRYYMTYHNYAK